jgi:hypothetical protein
MSETETFEIYFYDLSEDAKKRFLAFMRIDNPSKGNYDIFPIATFDIEEDVLKENAKETKASRRKEKQLLKLMKEKERKKPETVSFT